MSNMEIWRLILEESIKGDAVVVEAQKDMATCRQR
jgi:hypothetical protein